MPERTAQRVRLIIGACLAASTLLAIKLLLVGLRSGYPANLILTIYWVLCAGAAGALLAARAAGFWMLYGATIWGLIFGAQVSYVPLVLTFTPERLRIGVLGFVNVAVTVLAFWAHRRLRGPR